MSISYPICYDRMAGLLFHIIVRSYSCGSEGAILSEVRAWVECTVVNCSITPVTLSGNLLLHSCLLHWTICPGAHFHSPSAKHTTWHIVGTQQSLPEWRGIDSFTVICKGSWKTLLQTSQNTAKQIATSENKSNSEGLEAYPWKGMLSWKKRKQTWKVLA